MNTIDVSPSPRLRIRSDNYDLIRLRNAAKDLAAVSDERLAGWRSEFKVGCEIEVALGDDLFTLCTVAAIEGDDVWVRPINTSISQPFSDYPHR